MSEEYVINVSDEDSDEDIYNEHPPRPPPEIQGTLLKWTNYIHGWQHRYIILHDGSMSYYKSENDTAFGCRGSISICKAVITPHNIDECRFDVRLNDSVWYLRTSSSEERHQWVDTLEQHKAGLCRHGSAVSLTSTTMSTTSGSSLKKSTGLKEKLSELETYREILLHQIDSLQSYFDECAEAMKETERNGSLLEASEVNGLSNTPEGGSPVVGKINNGDHSDSKQPLSDIIARHGAKALDFRGESLTFKATTGGIITTLSHCVEIMNQREDAFRKKFEREVEKRRKAEEKVKHLLSQASMLESQQQTKYVVVGGPDYEEGPHSMIGEEEFYDAVESALDKMEEEEEFREMLRQKQIDIAVDALSPMSHHLWTEVEDLTMEQFGYAQQGVEDGVWQLFAEEGEMKMYRRELEEDGLVCDPLKAVHQVRGVTAHEMCHHFWSPDVRMEWDTSIEQMTVLEKVSEETLIFLQIHKRVWPTAQRDALFWSHIRQVPKDKVIADNPPHDTWIVCNHSTECPEAPKNLKYIRLDLTVCFVCQTFIDPPPEENGEITRDNLVCRLTYCSCVNPGGWAPASVLRAVYKREYPKFLKRFTQYVIDKCQDEPITFEGLRVKEKY